MIYSVPGQCYVMDVILLLKLEKKCQETTKYPTYSVYCLFKECLIDLYDSNHLLLLHLI